MSSNQKKILLWIVPRSLSTAFLRCMMSRDSCRGYLEPWQQTYYLSADRRSDRFPDVPDREGTTFKDRKAMLEAEHKGFDEVFVKDSAFVLKPFLDSGTVNKVLPDGYIHTFIIRHPTKNIRSAYEAALQGYSGFEGMNPEQASFREIWQLHEFVTQNLKQKSIILDADDLQKDPETILRLYCEAVGIEFQDSMINWRPLNEVQYKEFEEWAPWYKLAMDSTGILPKTPSKLPEMETLPEEVQKAIQDAIPYYEKLYEKRLQPQKLNCKSMHTPNIHNY